MNSISKDLLRFKNKRYLGHNPTGSVMIFILGVIVESIIHRMNLVRTMFTGRKRAQ